MAYTKEQLRQELIRRGAMNDEGFKPSSVKAEVPEGLKQFREQIGADRIPTDLLRDAAGGLMGGAQKIAATMGEAGQAIGGLAEPLQKYVPEFLKRIPDVNIREEMGMGQNYPVDLESIMSSQNPNPIAQGAGKYAPAIAAGGTSVPGQMVANGLYGAAMASPEQENLGGWLPEGRPGAAIEDASLAGLFAGAKPVAKTIAKPFVKAANYLRPNKSAKEFLATLGKGTKEENVQSLAKDIDIAYQAKRDEALAHKKPVFEQEGRSNIYNTPEAALPEGNLDKVAYYIDPGSKPNKMQLDAISKGLKKYRKSGDFNNFLDEVETSFNVNLTPNQEANLEHALSIPTKVDSQFLQLSKKYNDVISGKTQELLDRFERRPNLKNADELQSQLGDDMGKFTERKEKSGLNKVEDLEFQRLKELRDTLKSEMHGHLERVNPALADEYATFSKKYRENVVPYQEENATKAIANEPGYIKKERAENPSLPYNVTSSQMKTAFAEPSRAASQIGQDIGESGRNKILYNLLANETEPTGKGLATSILNAHQAEGYSKYITPEMVKFAKELLKREKWRKAGIYSGSTLAGIAGVGAAEEAIRRNL